MKQPGTSATDPKTVARHPVRKGGRLRFNQLLDALDRLLAADGEQQPTLQMIATEAGVPVSSVYHFFPSAEAANVALAERYHAGFAEIATTSPEQRPSSWQDIVRGRIRASAAYYNAHPVAMNLFFGTAVTRQIKEMDIDNTLRLARSRAEVIARHFHVSDFQNWEERFATAIAIVDGVFNLSFGRTGCITPEYQQDACVAAVAYLRQYLPEELPLRSETPPEPPCG